MSFIDALSMYLFKFVNDLKTMSFRGSFHSRRQEQVRTSGLLVLGIIIEHSSPVITLSKKWGSISHKSREVPGTFQLRAMFGRPFTIFGHWRRVHFRVCKSFVTISFWNVQSVTVFRGRRLFIYFCTHYVCMEITILLFVIFLVT